MDRLRTKFGIRSARFDAQRGFLLNGAPLKIKGVCLHDDAGALGTAVPDKVLERRLRLLKDIGCNAIRCSHNPKAPEFYDLCDRLGLLVMDEAFDEWTGAKRKWTRGWNVGRRRCIRAIPNFSANGPTATCATWFCATAIIRASSCGASATRLIIRAIRSATRPTRIMIPKNLRPKF